MDGEECSRGVGSRGMNGSMGILGGASVGRADGTGWAREKLVTVWEIRAALGWMKRQGGGANGGGTTATSSSLASASASSSASPPLICSSRFGGLRASRFDRAYW